jgi:hypothetical protein
MKITRRQLRKLIETRIKPSIPDASDEYLGKIDDLARQPGFQDDADTFADAFGYPEDRSYSDDLRVYDTAGMPTIETLGIYDGSIREPDIDIVIPPELVDDVINAHLEYVAQAGKQNFETAKIEFREAVRRIYDYVNNEAKKSATGSYYEYGLEVRGYRANEYEQAMMASGDII